MLNVDQNAISGALHLDFGGNTYIGTTSGSYHDQPYIKTTSSVEAERMAMIYGHEVDKDFPSARHFGAGVFMRGPGKDGDLWKYYRVKITACTFNEHLYPIPVTGVGPATISTADTGNQLDDFHHIGAPYASRGGNSLNFNELVRVKPFRTDIATRPICFGVIIFNAGPGPFNRRPYQYNVSVIREVVI